MKETGRLSQQGEQNTRLLISSSLSSLDARLAGHRIHSCIPQVVVEVLQVAVDTVERKLLEGIWIKWRKLEMNAKKDVEEAFSLLAYLLVKSVVLFKFI